MDAKHRIESGLHAEPLAAIGRYASMWSLQQSARFLGNRWFTGLSFTPLCRAGARVPK